MTTVTSTGDVNIVVGVGSSGQFGLRARSGSASRWQLQGASGAVARGIDAVTVPVTIEGSSGVTWVYNSGTGTAIEWKTGSGAGVTPVATLDGDKLDLSNASLNLTAGSLPSSPTEGQFVIQEYGMPSTLRVACYLNGGWRYSSDFA